ncbi:MAG TPA: hypothetical protein VF703_13760 [Pyrinomonadaceae bacterium]|jgi:hypothetical protein
MGKILVTLTMILALVVNANAIQEECRARMKFSADGDRPSAIYNLMADYANYSNRRYIGRIVHIKYGEDGEQIVGFALEINNGIRESIGITHDDCVYNMAPLEIRWLPHLIRIGNRVRVDAEITNPPGFIYARNIIVLNKSRRRIR